MTLPPLRIIPRYEQDALVETYLSQRASAGEIHILEAGCGRRWPFKLKGLRFRLTGVDMDQAALDHRRNQEKDLDDAVVGDLRVVILPRSSYDVIYNSYVLEHVEGAETVLENFVSWLKPGGLMIITIPDPDSVYGFFARVTPHWFHVLFYRYVAGNRNAGKPGHAPYPTVYDPVVSRRGFREFARKRQLKIVEECGFRKLRGAAGWFVSFVHLVSLGRLASNHSNLMYILEKRGPP